MKRKWTRRNGVIHLTLSDPPRLSGPADDWTAYLEKRGFEVTKPARTILSAIQMEPPIPHMTRVAIFLGYLFSAGVRTTKNIRREITRRKWLTPHPALAPFLRDFLSDEEIAQMGLEEIVTLHTPYGGKLLDIDKGRLETAPGGEDEHWHEEHGFACEIP